jgi:riboflavin synthase
MFTGLIEETGRVRSIEKGAGGARLSIDAGRVLEGAAIGDSVAVNGCCLTVVALDPAGFAADVVPETLARTTLGTWRAGDAVNLERPLRFDQRLGGHLVQGHVDGVGEIVDVKAEGDGRRVRIQVPRALSRFVAEKGSLAVDGVSLTVAAFGREECEIALVPHTLNVTVAGAYAPGRRVNLEVDLLARYMARLLESPTATEERT